MAACTQHMHVVHVRCASTSHITSQRLSTHPVFPFRPPPCVTPCHVPWLTCTPRPPHFIQTTSHSPSTLALLGQNQLSRNSVLRSSSLDRKKDRNRTDPSKKRPKKTEPLVKVEPVFGCTG